MVPNADGLVGRVFGGYQLLRVIGSGGAGTVYLAAKVDAPEQQVAVKVLMPAQQATPADLAEFKARFQREAKALQLLEHPHILKLIAYGEDAETGLAYMVLPYMAGGTLSSRLMQGALPLDEVGRYAEQIADALDYAHQQGIVHRDIKPGNVLLDERGNLYLADFGIAKIFDAAGTTLVTITNTGQVIGTAAYMSPEQAQGQDATAASDIYGLGMVLYHLVTGQVAFEGKSLTQVLLQITTTPPIPPRRLRPDLPPPAEAAILRALSKQPVDRFKSAGELAKAFTLGLKDEWAPGLHQATTARDFVPQPTVRAPREGAARLLERPQLLIAGVSALLLVAIAGALLLSSHGGGTTGPGTVTIYPPTNTPYPPTTTVAPGQPTSTPYPPTSTPLPPIIATVTPTATVASGPPTATPTTAPPTATPTTAPPTATPTATSPPTTEFPIPTASSYPQGITSGPDGALWFVEPGGSQIGRITTGGSFSEFPIPTAPSAPFGITSGPDGALWFTESYGVANKIGRITTGGSFTEFGVPTASSHPVGITSGPDGALWFTELTGSQIGRITTGGSFSEFPIPTASSAPYSITSGPDGALWFTEARGDKVGRITTGGSFTEFGVPTGNSAPEGITSGPDGALWFVESSGNKVGRITTGGSFSEFPIPTGNSNPFGITSGPDGALWFTEQSSNKIGRITTGGSFTEFGVPTGNSTPFGITSGPDRNLWFTEYGANNIGRKVP